MKKFQLFLITLACAVFIGCSSEDLQSVTTPQEPAIEEVQVPILFSSVRSNTTRADATGADAAALLGNKFVVTGYKGATTAGVGSIVFDNYLVEYAENTAHTTESNVRNWEYVGKGLIKHASDRGITSQKIKYWDYSMSQYDFIAWSTGTKTAIYTGTPGDGEVLVSAITPTAATSPATGLGTAYTFTGKAADLGQCYIADLVTIKKENYDNSGNKPVTIKFRQLGTKVRIALYETVPGYSVKDVKFYTQGGVLSNVSSEIVNNATIFTTSANAIYKEGTYTVTFPTVDNTSSADNNQAHVTFSPTSGAAQSTIVNWGALNYTIAEEGEKTTGNAFLGRSSNTATFAGNAADNYYTVYLPNETGTNLNLRVDYTLESTDGSGEVIKVKNSKAQVPSIYTQWKPGFAYTYLFKISDKTNGRTGVYDPTESDDASVNSDPAGLYPITFDAVVENAEDNDATQETITTIATPSITTYQQKSTVVNADEYTVNGQDIFVTVNEGDNLVTLTDKAALYTIPAGKTEAEVVDAMQMQDDDNATGTIKGRSGLVLTTATSTLTNSVEFGADGNAISVGTAQALRFTPAASTTYAFVYTKTAATADGTSVKYQALAWGSFPSGATKYRYDYKDPAAADAQKGVIYFYNGAKVTAFIGQGVSNLYTRTGAGTTAAPYVYTIASGYAVTGTDYYYTLDNGKSYTKATNIAYADFKTATLYTDAAHTTAKTETEPVDGKAYYDANGIYCVIMPQQTTGWKEADTSKYVKAEETAEVVGMTYFEKYSLNDGVYYTKIIKVQ